MNMQTIPVVDLVDENGVNELFGTDKTRYVVPVYQRAFAWGQSEGGKKQNEIVQLIEDVLSSNGPYYLGSLVVSKCLSGQYEDKYDYEVIDGQQRLTALYLIFASIGFVVNRGSLGYACRQVSMDLLDAIAEGKGLSNLPSHACASEDEVSGISVGLRTVRDYLNARYGAGHVEKAKAELREKFRNVKLFRIEVPERTDLNRYFEIMNTRGEQLEQQDVVKADLLSKLDNDDHRATFATVWDACSDMDGYVQMHFSGDRVKKGETSQREAVFGDKWSALPTLEWTIDVEQGEIEFSDEIEFVDEIESRARFDTLVDCDVDCEELAGDGETYKNARFEGIIGYPQFLLHVLRIFVRTEGCAVNLPEQTDAANLRKEFDAVFQGATGDLVTRFATCLLKCRYYFDKYIIKREYVSKKDEGTWSLKELVKSEGKKEGASYRGTRNAGDEYEKYADLLMIEACLRVSYTNPKTMHWITNALYWVYTNGEDRMGDLLAYVGGLAREKVRKFLDDGNYNLGVQTHNIVLNYLDYLLWSQRVSLKQNQVFKNLFESPFDFEFRNSVEHWYPQHPDQSTGCPEWSDVDGEHGVVDRFGNLALLPSSINAHFSNQSPLGKRGYVDNIKKGSLKLRIMAALTDDNERWRSQTCEEHEKEMLSVLKDDCDRNAEKVEVVWGRKEM